MTVGGGAGKLKIASSSVQLAYGSGHVDINSSYAAVAFGKYNILVDSSGVHINGAKGSQNF